MRTIKMRLATEKRVPAFRRDAEQEVTVKKVYTEAELKEQARYIWHWQQDNLKARRDLADQRVVLERQAKQLDIERADVLKQLAEVQRKKWQTELPESMRGTNG